MRYLRCIRNRKRTPAYVTEKIYQGDDFFKVWTDLGEPDGDRWADVIHTFSITKTQATESTDNISLMTFNMLVDFYKGDRVIAQHIVDAKTKLGVNVGCLASPSRAHMPLLAIRKLKQSAPLLCEAFKRHAQPTQTRRLAQHHRATHQEYIAANTQQCCKQRNQVICNLQAQ